ncbi:S8 family serine peptidase [Streptomyces sp. PmtG]
MVATAAMAVLAAGMTSPASAEADRVAPRGDRQETARGTEAPQGRSAFTGARHTLTLITGDRVTVDAKGRVTGFKAAKGREHIPVRTRTVKGGHTLVLPYDAQRLIRQGKVDQRLFDVTELSKKRNRTAQKQGLKLIVGYKGAASSAKADVRAAGDTTVRRSLRTLNADAVTTPREDAADLWRRLSSAPDVSHLWLDGTREVTLDKSVAQIGAPKAWEAGFDGEGTKIAVLDTGVDGTHQDLKGKVAAEKNFTSSPDAKDRYGHGTHVASTAAGTGAKSGGTFKGVAPKATLLNGKVLDDEGSGEDSGIVAGMEWAAAQGADVVNLSLGGGDAPGVDPLEAAVNHLAKDKGVLFAISAGNAGPDSGSVGSPGSADAALTVGAVDDRDKLADFSSRGPRVGDGAIKPDVTAPGVDITAAAAPGSRIEQEVGQKPEGYLTISGTSMAAPHVAGAAALLKQQHPGWKSAELKAALTGSTKDGGYTAFEQGSGRIAVDRAIGQSVVADPVSMNFGRQQWPHADDKPVTKKLTYRNLGKDDVTLDLSVTALDPKGKPAPEGLFGLGAKEVKVPAGGTASVNLTADTRVGGDVDGVYSAYVVAKSGERTVRTAAAVEREVESYDVTLKTLGRDGRATGSYTTWMQALTGAAAGLNLDPHDASGTVKVRVPKGTYLVDTSVYVDPQNAGKGTDWLVQPKLTVSKKTTVTLDARKAKPVDITVPYAGAKALSGESRYLYAGNETSAVGPDTFKGLRTAHLGPEVPSGLAQQWLGTWVKGADTQVDIMAGGPVKKLATGYTQHFKAGDFATVKVGMGASAPGRKGSLSVAGYLPEAGGISRIIEPRSLPRTRTLQVSALGKTQWGIDFEQAQNQDSDIEAWYRMAAPQTFKAGKTYAKTFNTGVFGPLVDKENGVFREGDELGGRLPILADGAGHEGFSEYTTASKSVLYRNGTKIAENGDPVTGAETFKVPAEDSAYKLTATAHRAPKAGTATTRVDASWTFRSKKTADKTSLPVSTARFGPKLDLASTAPAGARQTFPVTVKGAAAGANLKSLSVYVSYDDGREWTKLVVTDGKVTVKNPARGKGVSFKASITDRQGNESTVALYNAYYGK